MTSDELVEEVARVLADLDLCGALTWGELQGSVRDDFRCDARVVIRLIVERCAEAVRETEVSKGDDPYLVRANAWAAVRALAPKESRTGDGLRARIGWEPLDEEQRRENLTDALDRSKPRP